MYVALSSLFVLLVGLTIALIVFTPLKYYLPGVGYGNAKQIREYKDLKIRTDSVNQYLDYKQRYYDDLKKVLEGKITPKDTNRLELPKTEQTDD